MTMFSTVYGLAFASTGFTNHTCRSVPEDAPGVCVVYRRYDCEAPGGPASAGGLKPAATRTNRANRSSRLYLPIPKERPAAGQLLLDGTRGRVAPELLEPVVAAGIRGEDVDD